MPDVDFVNQAYDIPDEPDRVEKPGVAPVRPLKPEPPVHPGTFVVDEDDDEDNENEKGLHDLAVEAHPQLMVMYDTKTSHEWVQYKTDVTAFGHAVIANLEEWEDYNAYKRLHELRRVKEIVSVWRYDDYTPTLVTAVNPNLFGPDVREKHYPDSVIEVGKKGCKKNRMCITEESEAFGLLQYENCRDRWQAIFEYEAEHPNTQAPTYNPTKPETNPFKAKWSDDCQGSGSGWNPDAFEALADWEAAVKEWRKVEVVTGYKRWGVAQAKCKKRHEKALHADDDTVHDE